MRIVSQNKCFSFDFKDYSVLIQGLSIVICKDVTSQMRQFKFIGEYDTQERAIEVFEDIHKAYAPIYSISNGLTEEQIENGFVGSENIVANNIRTESNDYCITTYDNYVYYMPEK